MRASIPGLMALCLFAGRYLFAEKNAKRSAVILLSFLLLVGSTVQNETFLKIWYISFFVLAVIQFICGICLWIFHEPVIGCFILFTALYLMPLPIACLVHDEKKYRYLSFSGFGAFILILFVAALLLTEGEILDGLDFDFVSGESKKNR